MASVKVCRRRLDRQINQTEILINADLAPHADVSVDRPRSVLPRLVSVLAWPWNGVELPELLARPHVERANQPLRVLVSLDLSSFTNRGCDQRGFCGIRGSERDR